MTGIDISIPEEADPIEWEFMRVNNVGFWTVVINNARWNAFYNENFDWEAVATSMNKDIVVYSKSLSGLGEEILNLTTTPYLSS